MANDSQMPESAKQILGGKGKKLHTHEIHMRRTDNKGYVARHDLRDKQGNPPMDGQRGEAEYSLADKEAMLAHMGQYMGDDQEEGADDEG
jgi:hypothetical protein